MCMCVEFPDLELLQARLNLPGERLNPGGNIVRDDVLKKQKAVLVP